MLTLLGSLLGFLSSTFPEFLKLFRDSQDRKHELAILDRQIEQQRLGHSSVLQAGMCGIDWSFHLCREDASSERQLRRHSPLRSTGASGGQGSPIS